MSVEAFSEEKTYTVTGDSMAPALIPGDRVVVEEKPAEPVKKGDLVAINFKHTEIPIVKRVIAVSGDSLIIRSNMLIVNNEPVRSFDEKRWMSTVRQLERYGWVVPPNNIFILGDNPKNSRDSRRLGLISTSQIKAKVVRIIHTGAKPR